MSFNGIVNGMNDLTKLSHAKSRAICAENFTGEPGKGGMCELADGVTKVAAHDLGRCWKVNPYIWIKPHATFEIASIQGVGYIQHIWMTPTNIWRDLIIRIYWDNQIIPSVEAPMGDFFCSGWNEYSQLSSLAVCVN